jgi:branched-chain amino acid transport system ATP-binding protein
MTLMEFRSISKSYGQTSVLKDVNLGVKSGERHALIGPNGAGKSTLFHIASGKAAPNSGQVFFKGSDVTDQKPYLRARNGIGRSFQIINVFPKLTVEDNLRCAVAAKQGHRLNFWRAFDGIENVRDRAEELLEMVSLFDQRHAVAGTLAYGEQRRLELALAAAADPEIYLLDEPCAGLNTHDTKAAIALINKVVGDKSLLIVEHDMDVVFMLADTVSVLHQGTVLITGSPEEVKKSAGVKEAYLGGHSGAA